MGFPGSRRDLLIAIEKVLAGGTFFPSKYCWKNGGGFRSGQQPAEQHSRKDRSDNLGDHE
jgi:hypothetical protein